MSALTLFEHDHHIGSDFCSNCRCSKLNSFCRLPAVFIGLLYAQSGAGFLPRHRLQKLVKGGNVVVEEFLTWRT